MFLLKAVLFSSLAISMSFASWESPESPESVESASSEEVSSFRCDSFCPDDDATRFCCREIGFGTGYCKPRGFAECEGIRIDDVEAKPALDDKEVHTKHIPNPESIQASKPRLPSPTFLRPRSVVPLDTDIQVEPSEQFFHQLFYGL